MTAFQSLARRSLWAWVLVVLCLAGSLEIHVDGETFESDCDGETLAVPEVSHPVTETHVEEAFLVEVAPCPACLLQLQTRGADLSPIARRSTLPVVARVTVEARGPLAGAQVRPPTARAPPA